LAKKKILILDRDQNSRNQFVLTAKKMQIRVDSTADCNNALLRVAFALHKNDPYDAIFVDYNNAIFMAADLPSDAGFSTLVLMATPKQCNLFETKQHSAYKHFLTKPFFPSTIAASILEATGIAIVDNYTDDTYEEGVADFSEVSLLLVDDMEMNREVFIALLEPTKVKIDIAINGLEALEKFRNAPDEYDAIIMDVEMPVMGGYEATRAIRAIDTEKARSIPIIAMTANVFKSDIEKCMECGMNGHLSKPIDIKIVIETIRSFCVK
jgi:CheY-like chemotaxis protein